MTSFAPLMNKFVNFEAQKTPLTPPFQVWDKYGFDGIIAPVQALPQLPHGYIPIS